MSFDVGSGRGVPGGGGVSFDVGSGGRRCGELVGKERFRLLFVIDFHVFCIHFARVIVVTPVAVQQSPAAPAANHYFLQLNLCNHCSGDCCDGTALRVQRLRMPGIMHIFNTFGLARARVIVERLLSQK